MKAEQRRELEIEELIREGIPVEKLSRWRRLIGTIEINTASGRFFNRSTGERGRIEPKASMRSIFERGIPLVKSEEKQ